MKPSWWPGEEHEQFTEWAKSQGVIANGVSPARFPGRGLGMIATRNIEEGETIVTVPLNAMLTLECMPESFTGQFPEGTSVQAIFAAFLTAGTKDDLEKYELWRKTWPTRQDFEDSMPITWPPSLRGPSQSDTNSNSTSNPEQGLLPPSISGSWKTFDKAKPKYEYESSHQNLLPEMQKRLQYAWDCVVSAIPEIDRETFSYHWLAVNTRCFYYLMPGQEPPEDRNDAMAMLPFADYFNHSDVSCHVEFDGEKYNFWATKRYDEGEEIYMSYGDHPNDFLLAEYGFYLDQNDSEVLYLDDIIFKDLHPSLHEELEVQQYYGNYQLTASGVCFRTEIAACIKYMKPEAWRKYVVGQSTKGVNEKKSEAIIQRWIRTYVKEAETNITALQNAECSTADRKHQGKVQSLLKRWVQIKDLCNKALETVSC